ncbi:hypothetical protein V6C03_09515 [Methyloligella sp. 2.7D]|uniref:hypothetical protein n=1 Tax=unclassified Methyloligella TaxID=2625955 RepID=UPI00157CF49D|nr:hypothetical protein [Methyloligella sp. GL2]QKP77913.1 hypothetical protein HT051_10940 [Methyloligella sp. GL2]
MTVDLPEFLKSGEPARLIPVGSASQRERAAASVFLAALTVVRPFAEGVFDTLKKPLRSRSTVSAFTEVEFKKQPEEARCRPDGLLLVDSSRSEWRAIIEAKIGTATITEEQLARYGKLAIENGIDAVITISNELTAFPDHPPYEVPAALAGKVEVYHWSWMRLITLGTNLLSEADENFDPEQHFLLKEVLRYFSHDNTDVRGFHQMNAEWPDLQERVQSGAKLHKTHNIVTNTVSAWHQEQSDLCLIMSRKLKVPVRLKIKKHYRNDQTSRIEADAEELVASKKLRAIFEVPNVASSIEVTADVSKRTVMCRMSVEAPEDRKRYESRLNWLLRQLPDETAGPVGIHIRWRNGGTSFGWAEELRNDPKTADIDRSGALPKCFEVVTITDLGKKFAGVRKFIEVLEEAVPQFYDDVARHIRPWQPSPSPITDAESLADTVASLPSPKVAPRRVVKRGEVANGHYVLFEDGSIQVVMSNGTLSFKNLQELVAYTKRQDQKPAPRPASRAK